MAVSNPALEFFVSRITSELVVAEVLVQRTEDGFDIRHVADRNATSCRDVSGIELREIARFTEHKQFRPLKSAPTLRRGWRFLAHDAAELDEALWHLYPGAVADWFAAQQPQPPVTHYREFTSRQTGMYRITTMLSDDSVAQVARACCHRRFCLKQRLWTVEGQPPDAAAEKSLLPCLEPCAVLLEFARAAVRLEQGEERGDAGAKEVALFSVSELEQMAASRPPEIREADFSTLQNPRRAQLALEKTKLAAKGD